MIKLTDLKLGQKIYTINTCYKTTREHTITGLIKVNGCEYIYIDDTESRFPIDFLKRTIFFTKEKAQKCLDNIISKDAKPLEAREKAQSIKNKFLAENPKPISKGEPILIRIEGGKWVKTKVTEVVIDWYNRRKPKWRWEIISELRYNTYTLKTLGKNWKIWTELDELKLKKEELETKIAELEKEND